jgi:hypothetical protein
MGIEEQIFKDIVNGFAVVIVTIISVIAVLIDGSGK